MSTIQMKEGLTVHAKVIVYWATTAIITLELLAGGLSDLVHGGTMLVAGEPVADVITRLGYPLYLLTIIGVWKLLAVITLLVPRFPRLKEWAYAGEIIVMTGAAASNAFSGEDTSMVIMPLIFVVLALISWALRPQSRALGVFFPARS
ncbi:hypothetical protein KSC_069150 [Ktedonobacter sp. SOSP1-52]|uniref:DoxX family protein n=1 Tax=Ktedonobacter sp. SOSP1-52 TaxID=2778366 RepID=UPI0019159FB5|nr:DoxX family protein [Ktedonobacter sp. SOSP1-52]GHO68023.1 hypothetical protein KSC_069150 [Ktedonobacter sp. SOSP1-52]